MQFITTVTQKGQVTLPKAIRNKLNVEIYDKVIIEPAVDHIIIKPVQDILDLAGTFKVKKNKSVLKARDIFEKKYRRS